MNYKFRDKLLLIPFLVLSFLVFFSNTKTSEKTFCSPQSLAFDEAAHRLYLADVTGQQIICFDTEAKRVEKSISIGEKIGEIYLDNNRLFLTTHSPQGKLILIDLDKFQVIQKYHLGHSPSAISCNGDKLVVVNKFDNLVFVFDAESLKLINKFKHQAHFPERAELKDDKLYIMDLVPQDRADDIDVACQIYIYDIITGRLQKRIKLPSGSNAIKGSCLSKDKRYLYLTHIIGRFYIPAKTVKKGWMNTNALSIVDLESDSLLASVLLDFPNRGCANPWGVCASLDGQELAIALSGTDELLLIDRVGMHRLVDQKIKHYSYGVALEEMCNDLSFLTPVKRRVPLRGEKGVRSVIATDDGYWVSVYFSADVVNVNNGLNEVFSLYTNGNSLERTGEIYFNDATFCLQNWQSCTSCHVDDGRVDGLNWDLLNDGLGNPKNTKSLLYAHQTPPSMALGVRQDATTSVEAGIKHSLFQKNIDENIVRSIDAYVQSLQALPSPYLKSNGKMTKAAKRGEKIFKKKGCVHCHSGQYFTNGKSYVFDIAKGQDAKKAFDTPSLNELWRTAPYLHDGRASTLEEVLTTYKGSHFSTSLTDDERRDLISFLLSL